MKRNEFRGCVNLLGLAFAMPWIVGIALAYDGDARQGHEKSESCASCHEGDGRSAGLKLYPRIAGQHYAYLLQALREYRSGERGAGYAIQMTDAVKNLGDQDLADLARYYSEMRW